MAPPVLARSSPWTLVGESVLWPLGPSVWSLPSIGDCRGVAGQPALYNAAASNPRAFFTSLIYRAKAAGRRGQRGLRVLMPEPATILRLVKQRNDGISVSVSW